MRPAESLRGSFRSLSRNKLRSFLTMLGVIIGVLSVVMLTSIGEGVKKQVTSQVEALGANLLYIFPGQVNLSPGTDRPPSKLGVHPGFGEQTRSTLTYDDLLALKGKPGVTAASANYARIDYLDRLRILVSTTGADEDLGRVNKLGLRFGRFITKKERIRAERVAVIGDETNRELFGGANSLGKSFSLNGLDYRVVGVLRYKRPQNVGFGTDDINTKIYLPITEVLNRSQDRHVNQMVVLTASSQMVPPVERLINSTLERRHGGRDFTVLKQQDILNTINSIISLLTASLGGIAAISLVVGGIGIMNIMLVSVVERTREIGIRKAVGARKRDIMLQFLIESVILSLSGGILGLLLGIGGSRMLPRAFPLIHTAPYPAAIGIALVFALLVGIFFGVYPAVKAAGLNPIEALRGE